MRDILEKQIIIDAQVGDTTVLSELLSKLTDAIIYEALSDESQERVLGPSIATKVPEFNMLSLRSTEVIAVEEDGITLGTSHTEKGVFDVISDNYCGADTALIGAEWRKHLMELMITVDVTDEDNITSRREFDLRTTVSY